MSNSRLVLQLCWERNTCMVAGDATFEPEAVWEASSAVSDLRLFSVGLGIRLLDVSCTTADEFQAACLDLFAWGLYRRHTRCSAGCSCYTRSSGITFNLAAPIYHHHEEGKYLIDTLWNVNRVRTIVDKRSPR